jgi:hypothetical protein
MATDAATKLAEFDRRRVQAAQRVDELERERRSTAEAIKTAAAALADHERRGGRPAERQKLEAALTEARKAAEDPGLPAKIEGARARVRDLHAERAAFVGQNLRELVAIPEADGRAAVVDMISAAEQFVEAYRRRSQAVGQISALASAVARTHPSDVGPPSHAEPAARELSACSRRANQRQYCGATRASRSTATCQRRRRCRH